MRRVILQSLHLLLIGLLMGFIWGNSLLTAPVSSEVSSNVVEIVEVVLEQVNVVVEPDLLSLVVRKMAHGIEFFAFGTLLITYGLFWLKRKGIVWQSLLLGLGVALIDEGIQLFTEGRGAALSDVGIDFLGISLAVLSIYGLSQLLTYLQQRKKAKINLNA